MNEDKFLQAQKLTSDISDFLNNFHDKENSILFNEAMSREHRTLQQNFTRLVFRWIEYCASEQYRTDGRNEASAKISRRMIDGFREMVEKDNGFVSGFSEQPSKWLPTV